MSEVILNLDRVNCSTAGKMLDTHSVLCAWVLSIKSVHPIHHIHFVMLSSMQMDVHMSSCVHICTFIDVTLSILCLCQGVLGRNETSYRSQPNEDSTGTALP